MRIISQDGMIDIPYEHSCVGIDFRNDKMIYAIGVNLPDDENGSTMAKYSTSEKAKKAMDMLHDAYMACNTLCYNIIGAYGVISTAAYVKNNVFRFPREDEI